MKRITLALLALAFASPAFAQSTVGVYKATPPVLTDGVQQQVLLDAAGNLRVVQPVSDANGNVTQPALSSTYWYYAAATGGIVNTTTAVTVKAAAGASVRNYVCSIDISHDVLGAATELVINDGAAGTVMWRGKLQTAAADSSIGAGKLVFSPCLRGTANTLVEVKTVTAVTGGVLVNLTGYTGS